LFLDRDGVINVDSGHVHQRELFEFKPGIFELCRAAQASGYLLIVVTNQAGIARGYYSESDFHKLTDWMTAQFSEKQVNIARVYYCPYHPVLGIGKYRYDSPDRKPNPGMLLRAQSDLNLDLASSVLVGDKMSDILAAQAAGVGTQILLQQAGRELQAEDAEPATQMDRGYVCGSLDEIRLRFFSSGEYPAAGPEAAITSARPA
jgi:D-glycero-D-manno-heptose 1,7-bisphosphate phosphatase